MFNLSNLVNIQIPNFLEHNKVLKNCMDIKMPISLTTIKYCKSSNVFRNIFLGFYALIEIPILFQF